jgi:Cu/Ag efflux protein CusF
VSAASGTVPAGGKRRRSGAARARLAALAIAAAAAFAVTACEREKATHEAPLPPADATYTTRGVVRELPPQPGADMVVHHEAIAEFVDRKGERAGMDSMTMPFSVAPVVDLSGIERDSKVEMTFEVRWKDAHLRIVRLTELPAETELDFGGGAVTGDLPAPAAATPSPGASPSPSSR